MIIWKAAMPETIVARCLRRTATFSYHAFHVAVGEHFTLAHFQTDSRQRTPWGTCHGFAVSNVEPAFVTGTVHSPQIGSRQDGAGKVSTLLPISDKICIR